jgi:hypothetical protein
MVSLRKKVSNSRKRVKKSKSRKYGGNETTFTCCQCLENKHCIPTVFMSCEKSGKGGAHPVCTDCVYKGGVPSIPQDDLVRSIKNNRHTCPGCFRNTPLVPLRSWKIVNDRNPNIQYNVAV